MENRSGYRTGTSFADDRPVKDDLMTEGSAGRNAPSTEVVFQHNSESYPSN